MEGGCSRANFRVRVGAAGCECECFLSFLSLSTRQVSGCCCCCCCCAAVCAFVCLSVRLFAAAAAVSSSLFLLPHQRRRPDRRCALDRAVLTAAHPTHTDRHAAYCAFERWTTQAHAHATSANHRRHPRTGAAGRAWEEPQRQPASPRRLHRPPLQRLSTPRSALLLSAPRDPPPHRADRARAASP